MIHFLIRSIYPYLFLPLCCCNTLISPLRINKGLKRHIKCHYVGKCIIIFPWFVDLFNMWNQTFKSISTIKQIHFHMLAQDTKNGPPEWLKAVVNCFAKQALPVM